MAKQEYEAVAYTSMVSPTGLVVNVTNRAESTVVAYANLMEAVVVMQGDGFVPFERSYNKAQDNIVSAPSITDDPFPITPVDEVPQTAVELAQELGGVEVDPFNESHVELVDRLKKAGEWKTGDVQEVLVDQYKMGEGKIAFYKEGNEYPIHTHYLNEIGVKVMSQVFKNSWDKTFKNDNVLHPFPGGPMIIAVKGGKVRTQGQGAGNVFRNLASARRP